MTYKYFLENKKYIKLSENDFDVEYSVSRQMNACSNFSVCMSGPLFQSMWQ